MLKIFKKNLKFYFFVHKKIRVRKGFNFIYLQGRYWNKHKFLASKNLEKLSFVLFAFVARAHNCEYPLRNGLRLDDARPLLQADLVVLATLCSIFVELTQVQCLRSGHKTCKRIMQVLRPTLSHGTC